MPVRVWFVVAVLCLLVPRVSVAQTPYAELAVEAARPHVYHEAVAVPGADGPLLAVSFRIPNSLLVFTRNRLETPGQLFVANAEVTVRVFRGYAEVAEQTWRGDHYAATFDDTQRKTVDLRAAVLVRVPPGTYRYRLTLTDIHAGRSTVTSERPVVVPAFDGTAVGPALMAASISGEADAVSLRMVDLGGDVPYGGEATAAVPVSLGRGVASNDAALFYTLYQLDRARVRAARREGPDTGDAFWAVDDLTPLKKRVVASGRIEGTSFVPIGGVPQAGPDGSTLRWSRGGKATAYLVPIDLDATHLEDGAYVLDASLAADSGDVDGETRFRTHWRDIPVSLLNPEVAITNLRFIADRKVIRDLKKGGREDLERHVLAFWKDRDPTPDTPFNELMAEYYRRVDYAAEHFRTGQTPYPDGLETDRAEIYVVHGPPDDVTRTYPPDGGVREVWTYGGKRRFVFWAPTGIEAFELQATNAY